jgi:hypothetical protein
MTSPRYLLFVTVSLRGLLDASSASSSCSSPSCINQMLSQHQARVRVLQVVFSALPFGSCISELDAEGPKRKLDAEEASDLFIH